ncbi:uncharacterized protein MEPE_00060 [Melanopsichium pennsylvanicum]|uniref:Uncharacterized protein n=2 Tax=Melanopsichium pennsylvanicum TaxID=63383 RepID=A0AAJ4XG27_9BASI|nr:putative protein [Melanopsichium pennsylvanicum 4]SNX81355.1 uncharacterized protein MEPE_00060 [Melanopsichium pennsylvanicum]
MFSASFSTLLSGVLLSSSALATIQHSSIALDKRQSIDPNICWTQYHDRPDLCQVLQVAYYRDASCNAPLSLHSKVHGATIHGNTQMIWESAVAHTIMQTFGSIRIVGAIEGLALGFGKREESDTVVQNMAYMSSAELQRAYRTKACVTFPNLDVEKVGVWTVKAENTFNSEGYVWNPHNIPIKNTPECSGAKKSKTKRQLMSHHRYGNAMPVCLKGASWGGGGVLMLYDSDDCSGEGKRQLYSTAQCTPLSTTTTGFKSYKAIEPQGDTIDTIFSPIYYDMGQSGYHACSPKGVTKRPFKPNECQKFAGNDMFVGVYGNDPNYPQSGPDPGVKILRQAHGHHLFTRNPMHGGFSRQVGGRPPILP